MSKVTLIFDLDEYHDKMELRRARKATDAYLALLNIHEHVWRPSWKHGYTDTTIQHLIDSIPDNKGNELIQLLFEKYIAILEEYGIDVEEDLE